MGTGELGLEIGELLQEHAEYGLHPVGLVDHRPATPTSSLPLLGEVSDISAVVSRHDVRRIIVSPAADDDPSLVSALRADERLAAEVCVIPRMRELAMAVPASYLDEVWGIPIIPMRKYGLRRSGRALKRSFDLAGGTILLIVLGPLLLLLMGAVLLSLRQARTLPSDADNPVRPNYEDHQVAYRRGRRTRRTLGSCT